MSAKVKKRGDYELFETTNDNRILFLNGDDWYAWVEGQQSPLLVKSGSDHKRDHTISKGNFYLIDFDDDPDFRDQPHLFLEQGDGYKDIILPNGLPTSRDHQKRLVETDETIAKKKLEKYV
ncbi:MAG TPA: hypothetical protein PKA95_13780 [Thermomicrobiales bacterium]|nr:hypothetical protein [Thermomicrobiales bacterium]